MMTKEQATQFIQGVFTEVWCERDRDAVAKYYHPEFLGLLHGEEEFRFADVLKRVDYSKKRYRDPHCVFHDIIPVEDNRIVARVTMNAFDEDTQQDDQFHFMIMLELKNDKMIRQWTLSSKSYRYKDWDN